MSAPICLICEGKNKDAEFVLPFSKPICSSCINELSNSNYIFKFAEQVDDKIECTFCLPFEDRLTIPDTPIDPIKRLLKYETFTICSVCVKEKANIVEMERESKENFFKDLGPECGPENCRAQDCEKLRIRLAVYCLQHQYEDRSWIKGRGLEGYSRDE